MTAVARAPLSPDISQHFDDCDEAASDRILTWSAVADRGGMSGCVVQDAIRAQRATSASQGCRLSGLAPRLASSSCRHRRGVSGMPSSPRHFLALFDSLPHIHTAASSNRRVVTSGGRSSPSPKRSISILRLRVSHDFLQHPPVAVRRSLKTLDHNSIPRQGSGEVACERGAFAVTFPTPGYRRRRSPRASRLASKVRGCPTGLHRALPP